MNEGRPSKKSKVIYSKVPQFQEGGDGTEVFDNDDSNADKGKILNYLVGKPRTGKEKRVDVDSPIRPLETSSGTNHADRALVWERRRKVAEKVLGYLGQKVICTVILARGWSLGRSCSRYYLLYKLCQGNVYTFRSKSVEFPLKI
jgi:hypothetical protein